MDFIISKIEPLYNAFTLHVISQLRFTFFLLFFFNHLDLSFNGMSTWSLTYRQANKRFKYSQHDLLHFFITSHYLVGCLCTCHQWHDQAFKHSFKRVVKQLFFPPPTCPLGVAMHNKCDILITKYSLFNM